MLRLLVPTLCLLALPAQAQKRPHLCASGETPAFSCATGRKVASLCATSDADGATSALTYRFGTPKTLELTYPEAGVRPAEAFQRGVTGATGGGAEFLRFAIGDTRYVLYSDYYRGHESDGIVIERAGKPRLSLRCRGPALDGREGWSRVYKAGLPNTAEPFDVPGVSGR